jgi:hypothetical protein
VIAISAVNDRLAEEETPKDWVKEDGVVVPVKRGAKEGSSVRVPIMTSGAVLGKAFAGNIQEAEPAVMRTMEISKKMEPAGMRIMEISRKMEPAEMRTMAIPKVTMDKAVTTAVAFGNAGEIRKAAAVFDKGAYKR